MYLGDFTTANTVYVYFNTFDSNDPSASVTLTGLALGDIFIYKNGSTTERSSTAGYTLLDTDGIDFDGKTGIHGFSIDLSNNTDSGFYAAGGEYTVVVASVTVDAATVNFVAAHFSIERTGGALSLLKGTNSLADIESKIDTLQTNVGTAGAGLTNIGTIATVTNLTNLPTIPANWITAAGIDTGAIDADALAADAGTEIGTAVWATAARTLTAATNITSTGGTTVPQTGDSFARLGAPAGASVSADIAAIEAQTDDIGAEGAGLTAVPWNPAWDAEVQSEVTDALTAAAIPTATQNADALLNRDMSAVSDTTARSPLNALRLLRNKWTSSGGTLTVTKEDDTTSAWTATLTGDAAADPVVGSDPA